MHPLSKHTEIKNVIYLWNAIRSEIFSHSTINFLNWEHRLARFQNSTYNRIFLNYGENKHILQIRPISLFFIQTKIVHLNEAYENLVLIMRLSIALILKILLLCLFHPHCSLFRIEARRLYRPIKYFAHHLGLRRRAPDEAYPKLTPVLLRKQVPFQLLHILRCPFRPPQRLFRLA